MRWPLRVRVQGRRVLVTEHAAIRYQERVRPTLTVEQAAAELMRVLPCAVFLSVPPAWDERNHQDADLWLALTDDIVFPVQNGYVTTALTRGGMGETVRAARQERRARRNAQKPAGKKHGRLLREERARARRGRDLMADG